MKQWISVINPLSALEKRVSKYDVGVAIDLKCYKLYQWEIGWQKLTLKSLSCLACKLWESIGMLK